MKRIFPCVVILSGVAFLSLENAAHTKPQTIPFNPPRPNAMAISPDGKLIAVGFTGGSPLPADSVEIISVKTGRGAGILLNYSTRVRRGPRGFPEPTDRLVDKDPIFQPSALAFSPKGDRIAVGGHLGRIAIWDATKTGTELFFIEPTRDPKEAIEHNTLALGYFLDGKSIVSIRSNGQVDRWDATNGKFMGGFSLGNWQRQQAVALSKDGQVLVSAHDNQLIHVWNVETGSIVKSFQLAAGSKVQNLAISADGKKFVAGFDQPGTPRWSFPGYARSNAERRTRTIVFEIQSGKSLGEVPERFSDSQFSPSGKLLVSCDVSGPVRIWDIANGRNVYTFKSDSICQQVAPSPDGVHLIGRTWNGVTAWNVHTGERVMGQAR